MDWRSAGYVIRHYLSWSSPISEPLLSEPLLSQCSHTDNQPLSDLAGHRHLRQLPEMEVVAARLVCALGHAEERPELLVQRLQPGREVGGWAAL